jgi:ligand-binding SRPBCC domain-containing protein
MAERRFRNEMQIDKTPEDVFAFFSNAANLNRITPPWLHFKILNPDVKLQKGSLIRYRLRLRGIPLKWISEITEWNPPHYFVDAQIKGPYRTWIHKHEFIAEDSVTHMIDEVRYSLPGSFLEPLVNRFFVEPDIKRIFQFRTKVIEEIFKSEKPSATV